MILYRLRCDADHEFDAWFRNSETYDKQARAGLLACAVCGGAGVAKAPMAPRIGRDVAAPAPTAAPEPAPAPSPPVELPRELVLREMLRAIRRKVEAECDYVGPAFANEVRRIHDGEGDSRAIYGEATAAEVEALIDDGIEIGRVPWVPLRDG
jgi:hypothetical protein